MFSGIPVLKEIKEIRKQNEDFRVEARKNITEIKNEIKGLGSKQVKGATILKEKSLTGKIPRKRQSDV